MAIQPCFSSKTICNFINRPIGCVWKTRTNMHQRMRLDLPSSKPSWSSCSWYWFSSSSPQYCSAYSSSGSPSFKPWSMTHTNKHTIKKEIKVLRWARIRKNEETKVGIMFSGDFKWHGWNYIGNGVVKFRGNRRIFGAWNDRLRRHLRAKPWLGRVENRMNG